VCGWWLIRPPETIPTRSDQTVNHTFRESLTIAIRNSNRTRELVSQWVGLDAHKKAINVAVLATHERQP
jgi:formylmethanofuran dehydrogenase subunit E-like metal-binding protein